MTEMDLRNLNNLNDLIEGPAARELRRIARQEAIFSAASLHPFKTLEIDIIRSQINAIDNLRKIVNPTIEVFEQLKDMGITINSQMTQFLEPINETVKTLSSFSKQWQNLNSSLQFNKFTEISTSFLGVRNAILENLSFTRNFSKALRTISGNWMAIPSLPKGYFDSLNIRNEFYGQIGVSESLLEIDFQESISLLKNSHFVEDPSERKEEHFSIIISSETKGGSFQQIGFTLITEFENKLRKFIVAKMLGEFGPRWFVTQVPNKVKIETKNNQERDRKAGRKVEKIEQYFEFAHYEQIVLRKDNWENVFSDFFPYPEYFRESLRRINAPRRTLMHSREIDHIQFTLLVLELTRFEAILD